MITKEEVLELIKSLESDRIERTVSFEMGKLGPITCAFSNDFPNNKKSGFIILGVNDEGKIAGMTITDDLLLKIGDLKANGNVLPQPSIIISEVFKFENGDVVIVEVLVSKYPPVRYNGKCYIRIGPRMAYASPDEENILMEKRINKTFDLTPAEESTINDLSVEHFKLSYLPLAIDNETLKKNGRSDAEQLASLRFYDLKRNCPTYAGILVFGINPLFFLSGAYIQYVKFEGEDMTSKVEYEKQFSGGLIMGLSIIDSFIKNNIIKQKPFRTESFREEIIYNYPFYALRELIMNAIMHRSYESNSPIYIYEFSKSIEIHNSGGLTGDVNKENFPNASSYRNVVIAETLKILGYVNKFNYGVTRAIKELRENGNGEPKFNLDFITKFVVKININKMW